jgi:hypothetical protein
MTQRPALSEIIGRAPRHQSDERDRIAVRTT